MIRIYEISYVKKLCVNKYSSIIVMHFKSRLLFWHFYFYFVRSVFMVLKDTTARNVNELGYKADQNFESFIGLHFWYQYPPKTKTKEWELIGQKGNRKHQEGKTCWMTTKALKNFRWKCERKFNAGGRNFRFLWSLNENRSFETDRSRMFAFFEAKVFQYYLNSDIKRCERNPKNLNGDISTIGSTVFYIINILFRVPPKCYVKNP